jgi:signal transduction histidine kinase
MRKQTKTTQRMGIRMKIFMPVLLLLILLPCLIYGTLCMTSAGYLRRTAKQDVRRFTDQAEDIVICIEDDGPGIDAADLPHIFERYYKGEAGSFGIGLSVVASGIRYLGGHVMVENKVKPQHGVCYRLYLPHSGPKPQL